MKKIEKLLAFVLLITFLFYIAYEYYDKYFILLKNPSMLKDMLMSYGKYSILAFILLQIVQIVAFFIPGEVIEIAGGYIYGTIWGGIFSLIGIILGSVLTFYLSRVLGKSFVERHIKKGKNRFIDRALGKKNAKYIIFIVYLIPGIPKDIIGYFCGISNINIFDFMIYSNLGRIPAIFISAYFGQKFYSHEYRVLIIVGVLMTVLFLFGVVKGEKIISSISKLDENREN